MKWSNYRLPFLILFCWLAVAPVLWNTGTNIVTHTYARAALQFWAGQDPYSQAVGHGDAFKYSPLFAALYGLFAWQPDRFQALTWAFTNAAVFWWGMFQWVSWRRRLVWIAVALCALELDISLRYQQVNALMVGSVLFGLAAARDGQWTTSATILAWITNIKILPGFFAAAVGIPWKPRYWWRLVLASSVFLLLPGLWLGWSANLRAHASWFELLFADMSTPGLLDVRTLLSYWNCPFAGEVARWFVLVVSLATLAKLRFAKKTDWPLLYTVGATGLLLFSPRTESPTFVLFAPIYLFLFEKAQNAKKGTRVYAWTGVAIVSFAVTFSFSDAWPKSVWDPRAFGFFSKTLGALAVWIWGVAYAFRQSSRV